MESPLEVARRMMQDKVDPTEIVAILERGLDLDPSLADDTELFTEWGLK